MSNPLCHFEFMSSNPEKFKTFYGAIFGWEFDDESMPGYTLINAGTEPTGAIAAKPPDSPGACVNIYFQVESIDSVLNQAQQKGAKILVPKTKIPNVGHIAIFADPEGIPVGILEPAG